VRVRQTNLYRLIVWLVVALRIIGAPVQANPHAHIEPDPLSTLSMQQVRCHDRSDDGAMSFGIVASDPRASSSHDCVSDASHGCDSGECACPAFPAFGGLTLGLTPASQPVVAYAAIAPNSGAPNLILRPPAV
jgi:hypothetical protein